MTQKHKNAEWVKMFVEGAPVQWKMAGIDGAYHTWELVTSLQQFDDQGLMFRAKPEKVTTNGYKRYAWRDVGGVWHTETFEEAQQHTVLCTRGNIVLDNEWQYHEVEVESE